jgi:hypothetical protein
MNDVPLFKVAKFVGNGKLKLGYSKMQNGNGSRKKIALVLQYCTYIFAIILFLYLKQELHLYHDMYYDFGLLVPVKFNEVLHAIRYEGKKVNAINWIQSCRVLEFTELNFSVLLSLGSGQLNQG